MNQPNARYCAAVFVIGLLSVGPASAAVSADEAAKLGNELTPLGAQKAGNTEGTIPAWSGGLTSPTPGFKNGERRPDPFADEKPVLQITAKNMEQFGDKLTEGTKALLKKYPGTFRLDVYKTHRTAAAPQWIYDNTSKNATRASVEDNGTDIVPKGVYGGIGFPIPKTGVEVMLNTLTRWRGESFTQQSNGYQVTSDGRPVLVQGVKVDYLEPYYLKDGSLEKFNGVYQMVRVNISSPSIRAGEAIMSHMFLDESKTTAWTYLTGQRRVRKVPNACCDSPNPATAGIVNFDEWETYANRMDRFDWKLVGKREMYIPYNSNRILVPTKDSDIIGPHHLNPDHVRWELHRVWVVEASLKPGKRHTSPKSRYYIDEDSWWPVMGERWDANGELWRVPFSIPVAMPDIPAVVGTVWGVYELLSGTYFATQLMNESKEQYKILSPRLSETHFAPDALAGESVR